MSNANHNSALYAKTVCSTSRDFLLKTKFGERYTTYRDNWNGEASQLALEFPLHIEFMLSDSCNMRCSICHKRKRTNEQLSVPALKKIFEEGEKFSLPACGFGLDSEPLLEKKFFLNAIALAQKHGVMDIIVGTNGVLLTSEISKALIEKSVTLLCVSLDAATPETYKKMRNCDFFEKIERNIHNFLNIRAKYSEGLPKLRLSFCKTPLNAQEENLFIEKWEPIADQIDIQNYISTVGEIEISDDLKEANIARTFCQDPFRRVGILANGDVQCCCCSFGHPDIVIGNVNHDTLYKIWNGKTLQSIKNNFLNFPDEIPQYCKACLANIYNF